MAKTFEVKKQKKKFKNKFKKNKIILSLDRLDYTKGIFNRLQAYELFLDKNPDWHEKVILILVVVPSRIAVERYQNMKEKIDEMVGRINGKFGHLDWTPVLYQYKTFSFEELAVLYNISDIALITPLRDGMNLIAKEYIACKYDKTGVLILSEMAGSAKEMGESIIINPNSNKEMAEAIKQALEMPSEEQIKRNSVMQKRLQSYTVIKWADDFINKLINIKQLQTTFEAKIFNQKLKNELIKNFEHSQKRLILLDYDGTLIPFFDAPEKAKPTEMILRILQQFKNMSQTDIVLISGRDKKTLMDWFNELNINIVAEHGVWIKEINNEWQLIKPLVKEWMPKIMPLLQIYVDRLPGSFIEEKEYSIVWHYRKSDPELASLRAKELMDELVNFTANIDVQVLQGNKVIEVRNAGINKGIGAMHFISKNAYDFILAIGDDWTDEDLFKILPEHAYSIRVGMTQSFAKYNVYTNANVIDLLQKMVGVD